MRVATPARMISADPADIPIPLDDGFEIRGSANDGPSEAEHPKRRRGRKAKRRVVAAHERGHDDDEALASAVEDSRERIMIVARNVAHEVKQRPVAMIFAGIGLGFLLGGALSMRLGRTALTALGRIAMKRLVTGI